MRQKRDNRAAVCNFFKNLLCEVIMLPTDGNRIKRIVIDEYNSLNFRDFSNNIYGYIAGKNNLGKVTPGESRTPSTDFK